MRCIDLLCSWSNVTFFRSTLTIRGAVGAFPARFQACAPLLNVAHRLGPDKESIREPARLGVPF
jgi:hypothetical protein